MKQSEEFLEKISELGAHLRTLGVTDRTLYNQLEAFEKSAKTLGASAVASGCRPEEGSPSEAGILAAIVESSDDAIVSKSLEGNVSSWNPSAERIFGYSADEAVGQPITFIFPPELIEEEDMILDRLRRGEHLQRYQTTRVHKDGERITISLSVSPVYNESGEIVGASSIARNITEEERAKSKLAELESLFSTVLSRLMRLHEVSSEARGPQDLQSLLEKILEGVLESTHADKGHIQVFDPETGSPETLAHSGLSQDFLDYLASDLAHDQSAWAQALKRGRRFLVENVFESPVFAGTPAIEMMKRIGVAAAQSTPLKNRNGELVGMMTTHFPEPIILDETEARVLDLFAQQIAEFVDQIQTAECLSQSRARLQAIFESITDAVVFANPDRRIEMVNPAFTRIFGYEFEEVLGRTTVFLYASLDEYERVGSERYDSGQLSGAKEKPDPLFEIQYRHKDGHLFWCESLGVRVRNSQAEHIGNLGIHRDITERKESEKRLFALNQTLERRVQRRTEKLVESRNQLRALAVQLSRAEQEERKRLAELLHGHLQQLMVAGRARLELAGKQRDLESSRSHIRAALSVLNEALKATRALSVELSPPVLEESDLTRISHEWLWIDCWESLESDFLSGRGRFCANRMKMG